MKKDKDKNKNNDIILRVKLVLKMPEKLTEEQEKVLKSIV